MCPFFFPFFFHLVSSASMSARVFKFCINDEYNQVYYWKQNQGAEICFCFLLFFSFVNLSKVMNIEIFVKDFSGTTLPMILKFGTKIRYERLYCVSKNQPHMAYQSIYLSIFHSFQQFFHLISSASMSATVFKYCIHNKDNQVYYCKQNQGAEIFFVFFFCFSFFPSVTPM